MKFFEYTSDDYEYIVKKAMLNEEYQKLLEYKIKGYTIVKIADLLNISTANVSVMTNKLKKKIRKIL